MESQRGRSTFALVRVLLPLVLAVVCGGCVGEVRFVKFANAAFDVFTANPTPALTAAVGPSPSGVVDQRPSRKPSWPSNGAAWMSS